MADDKNAPTLVTKALAAFEIKDAAKGEVQSVIATLGVIDRDGDIIRKSAIPDGARVVVSSYGHDAVYGSRPAGKGTLSVKSDELRFDGAMFLNTTDGRETFEVLKAMGSDQEWSFGFRVLGWEVPSEEERKQGATRILTKLDAFEVSPVLIGAGIGTRTLAVKTAAAAQADGDGTAADSPPAPVAAADAEEARVAAETKAAADAARDAGVKARAADEFERFQRTMRRRSA